MGIQKVVVVDGNNLIVRIDRGVAGRSVTDVVPVEIDNALYLEFYFSDGTTETVGPVGTIQYIGTSPIVVTGSTISLSTVPVNLGGTGATTASGARTNLGLGSISTQDASSVAITGGSITGITDLAIADGGTGASTASGARTNLGLGTIATQDSSNVSITGGSITGITDLAIADGGTGASTASGARTNLGLGTSATLNAGVANGVATLDSGGTVPLSQIPASIQGGVSYQGAWNASTNTPTLTSSVGTKGYYYVVSVAGNTNLNGITDWVVGDWAIFNGSIWQKIDNTDAVTSVNGYTGTVVLTNTDISGFGTMSTQNANNVSITGGSITGITDLAIADGGTGASTANAAFNNLVPSQTGNAGKYLTTDGSNTSWAVNPLGTVTSVAVSGGTTGLTTSGGPITTSGTITLAGTLAVANGGTGATTAGTALSNLGGIGTITSSDGSLTVTPSGTSVDIVVQSAGSTTNLLAQVRNQTGATLTKGTIVYISGGSGNKCLVSKAQANSEANSSTTFGMITSDILNNQNGYVTISGIVSGLDTSAFTDGTTLYLSPTVAGGYTSTKPYAPYNLVYVGTVTYSHPTQGSIQTRIQNGYELDELHNVAAQSPTTGQTIVYNSATSLWEKNTVSLTAGVNGTLPIANGGTGQTTATAAFNALAPSQTGNSGKYLTTDGTNTSWATNPLGTVTSVSGTGTVNGLTLTGTVTTSGNLTLGGTLDLSAPPAIGGTTPNSGAFTTLSASGNVTLSGGTANGVLYLNGSKVATSGSALTFDGTNFATTGKIGAGGNPGTYTQIWSTGNVMAVDGSQIGFLASSSGAPANYMTGSNASNYLAWIANNSEAMRLTSTGLGIGTSSPGTKLEVTGDITGTWTAGATRFVGSQYLTGSSYQLGMKTTMDTRETQIFAKAADTGGYVTIATGITPSERVRVDGSGNVGIGTSSPGYKLETVGPSGDNIIALFRSGDATAANNAGGGFRSISSATAASRQAQIWLDADGANFGGGDYFYINKNGNSGTVDFVQYSNAAMRFYTNNTLQATLDSSGNLGLGVTPSASSGGGNFNLSGDILGGSAVTLGTNWYFNGGFKYKATGTASRLYLDSSGGFAWYTAASGTAGNAISFTQAMTLDASGNLLVGTTSNSGSYKTLVSHSSGELLGLNATSGTLTRIAFGNADATFGSTQIIANSTALAFVTGSAERARIDSSGNLLVGTTDTSATAGAGLKLTPLGGLPQLAIVTDTSSSSNVQLSVYNLNATNNGYRFYVRADGGIYNYSANNFNLSDESEKTQITLAGNYLEKLCQIPVKTFLYKDQNDSSLNLGVIAQDVEKVCPEFITKHNIGTEEEPSIKLGVYETDLKYAMLKAIQELKAEFDAYKASHP